MEEDSITITKLPEDCLSQIISFTSPRDACRSSLVSPVFRSAADSDDVWDKFLPSDHHEITGTAINSPVLASLTKKQLYFHLCRNPIPIANGTMSFMLDHENGGKCYMIGARALSIVWGHDSRYWRWRSLPESRFSEAALLNCVWWLDVKGKIEARKLSPQTLYAAYLVFKFVDGKVGFNRRPVQLHAHFEGSEDKNARTVYLDPSADSPRLSEEREGGWMEIEMGEFFDDRGDDGTLVFGLSEVDNFNWKRGLVIEGIELRPKK
ncbi:hypothetical protein ACFE04_012549 [Oxalis oulophora]